MINEAPVRKAILKQAREHPYHPIRDYLDALPAWDKTPRLAKSFATYWGAEDTPVNRKIGEYWWIQLVARSYEPGCQADYILQLIGLQGILKSQSLRVIVGKEYFTDSLTDITDHRKAGALIRGKWMIEVAEMVAFLKAGKAATKAWVTKMEDEYQPPYGHKNDKQKRQGVIVGTGNENQFLNDPTGDRRSWTIACGKGQVDIEALRRDRDQLLAEAVHRYKAGERRYPTPKEQAELFRPLELAHTTEEIWQVLLTERLAEFERERGVCVEMGQVAEFLKDRVGKSPVDRLIGPHLRTVGWTNETVKIDGKDTRFWWRASQRALWKREKDGRPVEDDKWTQVTPHYLKWTGGAGGVWAVRTAAEYHHLVLTGKLEEVDKEPLTTAF
jgi:predicted P-loop ATPase